MVDARDGGEPSNPCLRSSADLGVVDWVWHRLQNSDGDFDHLFPSNRSTV